MEFTITLKYHIVMQKEIIQTIFFSQPDDLRHAGF